MQREGFLKSTLFLVFGQFAIRLERSLNIENNYILMKHIIFLFHK